MYNSNIPVGFDENGVYRGNGIWHDEEDYEVEEKYSALKGAQSGHFVECLLCGKIINAKDAEKYCAGYLCELCREEL